MLKSDIKEGLAVLVQGVGGRYSSPMHHAQGVNARASAMVPGLGILTGRFRTVEIRYYPAGAHYGRNRAAAVYEVANAGGGSWEFYARSWGSADKPESDTCWVESRYLSLVGATGSAGDLESFKASVELAKNNTDALRLRKACATTALKDVLLAHGLGMADGVSVDHTGKVALTVSGMEELTAVLEAALGSTGSRKIVRPDPIKST